CLTDCTAKKADQTSDGICHEGCAAYCNPIPSCYGETKGTSVCLDGTKHAECCEVGFVHLCTGNKICVDGACVSPPTICDDGKIEGNEDCDFDQITGNPKFGFTDTCEELGFTEGTLGCTPNCRFDTSNCVYTPSFETVCNNDIDDDGDDGRLYCLGLGYSCADCHDPDCIGKTCTGSTTTCNSQYSIDN
ncbi:unnamed protein product, partial [marine sediment metagenome]